ncbi:MAG: hypothetical protein IKG42_04910 [Clostridia bacterium]|nr:hypothetical protein [Clostridia bacterium]
MDEEKKETVENEEKVEETEKVGTQANENKDEGKAEKTYTQAEYNALDKKLKEKYEKKYEGIDIKAYKEWVESQKTAEQKESEKETEYKNTLSKNESLEKENKALKSGVNTDDLDYVIFKVSKMDGDFNDNLETFLKDNPKFLNSNKGEKKEEEINLGGNHTEKGNTDLSKMSYEEYKAYRKNNG